MDLQSLDYDARLVALADLRIGVWDVIASASRRGSLDQAIREAQHNRIEQLLHDFSDLHAIAFNGLTAASVGRRLIGKERPQLVLIDLPSSSAANTRPFVDKAAAWAQLREFIEL